MDDPATTLRSNGIEPDATHVVDYLQQFIPSDEQRARIQSLVGRLGSDNYAAREEASGQLRALGFAAVAALRAATGSDDLEVRVRAEVLLADWEGVGRNKSGTLLRASLAWLQRSRVPRTTPLLLSLLASPPEADLQPALCQALWACAGPRDAERLARAVAQGNTDVKTAAIPALELAMGEPAVPRFADTSATKTTASDWPRRGADRSHAAGCRGRAFANVVVDRPEPARQAAWLLQQASNIPPHQEPLDLAIATGRWKAWAATAAAEHPKPLGVKRLQLSWYGLLLRKMFADEAASIAGSYHQFHYEATVNAKAEVRHGILRLESSPQEADQRLYVTAKELLGQPTFPRRFVLKGRLGGEVANPGAWHVGLSIGKAKFLFHPGLEGGVFRIETVDEHRYLADSASMPFLPAADVLHEMTIDATRNDDGSVRCAITVRDGGRSGRQFTTSVTLNKNDIGDIQRIGLERSGREGAPRCSARSRSRRCRWLGNKSPRTARRLIASAKRESAGSLQSTDRPG